MRRNLFLCKLNTTPLLGGKLVTDVASELNMSQAVDFLIFFLIVEVESGSTVWFASWATIRATRGAVRH